MQNAETVLDVLRERGRRGLPLDRLYRQMFNPQLYLLAYGRIYANKGAMTPGATPETVDGMSMGKIGRIVPPTDVLPYHYRRVTPHVFTTDEIDKLMVAAARLQPAMRAATWHTLLGLLVVTGMRISEVCNLNVDDIDEDSGAVRIVNSKFNKSRQVMLHPTTLEALATYRRQRQMLCPSATTPALLINSYGGRQQPSDAPRTFRELVDAAGLVSRSGQRRPRLHDIRHSVAVWTLMDFYRDGGDVQARLPLLSTWLGHIDPKSTYWYLQAVPELLALAAGRLEADSGQVPS